jgi:hypothetical protein
MFKPQLLGVWLKIGIAFKIVENQPGISLSFLVQGSDKTGTWTMHSYLKYY